MSLITVKVGIIKNVREALDWGFPFLYLKNSYEKGNSI